jgi:hypothetical protein
MSEESYATESFNSFGRVPRNSVFTPLNVSDRSLGVLRPSKADAPASLPPNYPEIMGSSLSSTQQSQSRNQVFVTDSDQLSLRNGNGWSNGGKEASTLHSHTSQVLGSRSEYGNGKNSSDQIFQGNNRSHLNNQISIEDQRNDQIRDSYNRKIDELAFTTQENERLRAQMTTLQTSKARKGIESDSGFRYKGSTLQSSIRSLISDPDLGNTQPRKTRPQFSDSTGSYSGNGWNSDSNDARIWELTHKMSEFQNHLSLQDNEIRYLSTQLTKVTDLLALEKAENSRLKEEIVRLSEENSVLIRNASRMEESRSDGQVSLFTPREAAKWNAPGPSTTNLKSSNRFESSDQGFFDF